MLPFRFYKRHPRTKHRIFARIIYMIANDMNRKIAQAIIDYIEKSAILDYIYETRFGSLREHDINGRLI